MKQHISKIAFGICGFFVLGYGLAIYWSSEPDSFDVIKAATQDNQISSESMVTGYVTTHTLIKVTDVLLNKPGGYLSNDILPPSAFDVRFTFSSTRPERPKLAILRKARPRFNPA